MVGYLETGRLSGRAIASAEPPPLAIMGAEFSRFVMIHTVEKFGPLHRFAVGGSTLGLVRMRYLVRLQEQLDWRHGLVVILNKRIAPLPDADEFKING